MPRRTLRLLATLAALALASGCAGELPSGDDNAIALEDASVDAARGIAVQPPADGGASDGGVGEDSSRGEVSDGGSPTAAIDGPVTPPASWPRRPVFARMYQQGLAVGVESALPPSETLATYTRALADFRPTYVSGLIRINAPRDHAGRWVVPSAQMVADWNTVRAAVHAQSPRAVFDVVLSATSYSDGAEIADHMQQIVAAGVRPEVWFFDFYTDGTPDAHGVYPVSHAIAWAHANHYLVGGHFFSNPQHLNGTEHSDFYALVDASDLSNTDLLDKLDALHAAVDVPLLAHINNNPQNDTPTDRTGSCIFNEVWTHAQRHDYLHQFAANQAGHHYRFMYNAFFPDCRDATGADHYYDAQTDCPGGAPMSWASTPVGACPGSSTWDAMKQLADGFNAL